MRSQQGSTSSGMMPCLPGQAFHTGARPGRGASLRPVFRRPSVQQGGRIGEPEGQVHRFLPFSTKTHI